MHSRSTYIPNNTEINDLSQKQTVNMTSPLSNTTDETNLETESQLTNKAPGSRRNTKRPVRLSLSLHMREPENLLEKSAEIPASEISVASNVFNSPGQATSVDSTEIPISGLLSDLKYESKLNPIDENNMMLSQSKFSKKRTIRYTSKQLENKPENVLISRNIISNPNAFNKRSQVNRLRLSGRTIRSKQDKDKMERKRNKNSESGAGSTRTSTNTGTLTQVLSDQSLNSAGGNVPVTQITQASTRKSLFSKLVKKSDSSDNKHAISNTKGQKQQNLNDVLLVEPSQQSDSFEPRQT